MTLAFFQILTLLTLPSEAETNDEAASVSSSLYELSQNLFRDYDSSVPPVPPNGPTVVSSLIMIQHIQYLDPKQESLKFQADMTMYWNDGRLMWNPADYSNIQDINVFKNLLATIWWPQLFIKGVKVVDFHNTEAILRFNGQILTTSSVTVEAKCSMDYTKYPNDEAVCVFYMGAPLYSATTFRFSDDQVIFGSDLFHANKTAKSSGNFRMTKGDATVYYVSMAGITRNYTSVQNNPFSRSYVRYEVRLKRNPTHYFLSISLPVFALTILAFVSVTLVRSNASVIILFCCLILQVFNHTVIIKDLPPNYDTTPICARMALVSLAETCILLVYRLVMNYLHNVSQGSAEKRRMVYRVENAVFGVLCVHALFDFWLIIY